MRRTRGIGLVVILVGSGLAVESWAPPLPTRRRRLQSFRGAHHQNNNNDASRRRNEEEEAREIEAWGAEGDPATVRRTMDPVVVPPPQHLPRDLILEPPTPSYDLLSDTLPSEIRYNATRAADLHQQLLATEEANDWNYTPDFREFLLSNTSPRQPRKHSPYQQRQQQLQREIVQHVDAFTYTPPEHPCTICGVELDEPEREGGICRYCLRDKEYPVATPVEPKVEWRAVLDPDTQELFYWNEDTGEMKWEPPE